MTATIAPSKTYRLAGIDEIKPAPDNLRQDIGDLTELVASIHAVGIIEPLVVDQNGEILAGHRRHAAARAAGLAQVPVVVRAVSTAAEAAEIMLIENLQRAGLNPIEEGTGYARLAEIGLTQREIAERVGCNQSHVSKRIKLAGLPAEARDLVVAGDLHIDMALDLAHLVELDADVADQWLIAVRSDGVARTWPGIKELTRRVTVREKKAAAEAEGKASGLKLIRNVDELARAFERTERETATHWSIDGLGDLVWYVKRSDVPATAPLSPTKPRASDKPKPTPAERAADIERLEAACAEHDDDGPQPGAPTVDEWVAAREKAREVTRLRKRQVITRLTAIDLNDQTVVDQLHAAAAELVIAAINGDTELNLSSDVLLAEILAAHDDLGPLRTASLVIVASAAFASVDEMDPAYHRPDAGMGDLDVATYGVMVRFGYDLDKHERACLGDAAPTADPVGEPEEPQASAPASSTVPDLMQALADSVDAAKAARDKPAELTDDEWDQQRTTAPWKAYPFVGEVQLVGGIREHGNPVKLRWAKVYEAANKNRPLVLAALDERLAELGE